MAGYIGSKTSVTQVDGYNRTEANDEFVSKDGDTITTAAGTALTLDRTGSDGTIIDVQKDGTSVGEIGAQLGGLFVGHQDVGVLFYTGGQDRVLPRTSTVYSDGVIDMGDAGSRFKDLYLSGGVYLGGAGAANHLDDYEEGDWTPTSVSSGTASTTRARYTKIGRQVTLQIENLILSDTTSGTAISIGGLPFAGGIVSAVGSMISQYRDNDTSISPFIGISATEIRFYKNSGTGQYTRMNHNMFNNSAGSTYLTIAYFTA